MRTIIILALLCSPVAASNVTFDASPLQAEATYIYADGTIHTGVDSVTFNLAYSAFAADIVTSNRRYPLAVSFPGLELDTYFNSGNVGVMVKSYQDFPVRDRYGRTGLISLDIESPSLPTVNKTFPIYAVPEPNSAMLGIIAGITIASFIITLNGRRR